MCALTGWAAALSDPAILAALSVIHDDPARPWTVQALAQHAALSRAAFARRFRVDPVRITQRRDAWRVLAKALHTTPVFFVGGVVDEDAIRSLAISQNLLGTEEIVLIHHTDCGMLTFTDEELAQKLEDETGQRPEWSAHAFGDVEGDVRAGIEKIKASPFVPRTDSVRGFVYEVETGALREVS